MNHSDRDRLLLEYLDGTASPSDRSHVEAMLAASAEWRSRHAELAGLLAEITHVERALPPSDLRDRVLEGIRRVERGHRTMAGQKRRGSWTSWLMHLGPRPRVLVAASFALGLVLGTVAMGPALHALKGDLAVLGTMGGAAAPGKLVQGDARMIARSNRVDTRCRVNVEVSIPAGATAEISDPQGHWVPVGLRRQTGAAGGLEVEGRRAIWSGATRGRFLVDFTGVPQASSTLELILTTTAGSSRALLPVTVGPTP